MDDVSEADDPMVPRVKISLYAPKNLIPDETNKLHGEIEATIYYLGNKTVLKGKVKSAPHIDAAIDRGLRLVDDYCKVIWNQTQQERVRLGLPSRNFDGEVKT